MGGLPILSLLIFPFSYSLYKNQKEGPKRHKKGPPKLNRDRGALAVSLPVHVSGVEIPGRQQHVGDVLDKVPLRIFESREGAAAGALEVRFVLERSLIWSMTLQCSAVVVSIHFFSASSAFSSLYQA